MHEIGPTCSKWPLFLLLLLLFACSTPTSTAAHTANDTASVDAGATPAESSTTSSSASSSSTLSTTASPQSLSLSSLSARRFPDTETVCPFRTFNHITHTLPQQCAKTSWSAPGETVATEARAADAEATPGPQQGTPEGREGTEDSGADVKSNVSEHAASAEDASGTDSEHEIETDSPFDNANFLSFEDWKKKNLAQAGQSPENVGQGRAAGANQAGRRRPVNVNALDSLGEEGEIEIDFSGFGNPSEGENVPNSIQSGTQGAGATKTDEEGKVTPSSWALSKDAGKTCKERFNYASFDCAANVLKTNKKAKSSSSILVENKDSYMLNECSAENKFLIVELCDDILADTIVLANYEFFSSMFRHFRVSVSDRYPVKMERWRTLGTFEARNSRDIQAFLITEPQIWARYLRVEFLTHYGNEFYCPLSLLRIHGTTMMEQFRREEEEARGVHDDDEELEETAEAGLIKPNENSGPLPPDQIPVEVAKESEVSSYAAGVIHSEDRPAVPSETQSEQMQGSSQSEATQSSSPQTAVGTMQDSAKGSSPNSGPSTVSPTSSSDSSAPNSVGAETTKTGSQTSQTQAPSNKTDAASQTQSSSAEPSAAAPSSMVPRDDASVNSAANSTSISSSVTSSRVATNGTASSQTQSQGRGSSTQPNPAAPSTQESFFKSIHKRLQSLEANSTLSLQYIEEQSRILRDAFMKVEKRQLTKTEKFLDHLNSTVMQELKSYRNMYDQLWQSTIIELESMKERQKAEVGEIGARLSLMADELVWQKRMAVVQSTLLLLCLGLVLFVRSGTLGSAADVPIVQQLGNKYTSFFESSPPRHPETGLARRRRTFRNMWRSDTSAGMSDHPSDGVTALSDAETEGQRSPNVQAEYDPPTPTTPAALGAHDALSSRASDYDFLTPTEQDSALLSPEDQAKRVQILETQSGPATPNGTRDCRPSWEEVDRQMDQLKAEEHGPPASPPVKHGKNGEGKSRKKKRSPLRRTHSNYTSTASLPAVEDSPAKGSTGRLSLDM